MFQLGFVRGFVFEKIELMIKVSWSNIRLQLTLIDNNTIIQIILNSKRNCLLGDFPGTAPCH